MPWWDEGATPQLLRIIFLTPLFMTQAHMSWVVAVGEIMKQYLFSLATMGFLCLSIQATNTDVRVGNASIVAEPDYVQVTVSVTSKCFPSMAAVDSAHDTYVATLQNRFEGYYDVLDGKFNSVHATAGWASPYTHVIYHRGGDDENVCQNTYQKQTTITIKTSDIDNFNEFYRWIFDDVGQVLAGASGDEKTPSTLTSISAPSPQICDKTTRPRLYARAQKMALENAIQLFQDEWCGSNMCLQGVKIVESTEPGSSVRHESYAKSAAFDGGSEASVRYTLDQITVDVSRKYVFTFPDFYPFSNTAASSTATTTCEDNSEHHATR
jgi:hypothetical protein